jgi:hypothetical protein
MPVRFQHDQQSNSFYFVTFTCYKWLSLFEETNSYDAVYKWFDSLYANNAYVTGYVIMPNHLHALLYFPPVLRSVPVNKKLFERCPESVTQDQSRRVGIVKPILQLVQSENTLCFAWP